MEKANNNEKYGCSWSEKYYDRLKNDPEAKALYDEYIKRFNFLPDGNEELDGCSYMGYEELLEKVKICLERNVKMIYLEIPDYDELLDQGVLF